MTNNLAPYFEAESARTKANLRGRVADLRARLVDLDRAIDSGMTPSIDVTGDLGLVGPAVEIQRAVDAWLTAEMNATYARGSTR